MSYGAYIHVSRCRHRGAGEEEWYDTNVYRCVFGIRLARSTAVVYNTTAAAVVHLTQLHRGSDCLFSTEPSPSLIPGLHRVLTDTSV